MPRATYQNIVKQELKKVQLKNVSKTERQNNIKIAVKTASKKYKQIKKKN